MAASNWDTLALNVDSVPIGGAVENHQGITLEIYKNWLYVRDPSTWQEGRGWTGDVVMKITEGHVEYGAWETHVRRGPQNGCYVVAWSARYRSGPEPDDFTDRYEDRAILVGCGVYGYENERDVYAAEIAAAGSPELIVTEYSDGERTLVSLDGGERKVIATNVRDMDFVGVLPSSLEFLEAMTREIAGEEQINVRTGEPHREWPDTWLRQLDWSKALRANQGDLRYFAELTGETGATPPGEAPKITTFQQIIAGMTEE